VRQLCIEFKKVYDSVWKEALYDIVTAFGIPMKLGKLIKMCLYDTYSRIRVGKYLPDIFLFLKTRNLPDALPIKNCQKKGAALSSLFFHFALQHSIRDVQLNQKGLKLNGTHKLLVSNE
jgi:hypothetical protein